MELCNAVQNNNIEEVIKLLKTDIDINYQDDYGQSALHLACKFQNLDIVKILLNSDNININLVNIWSRSPILVASSTQNLEIVKVLLKDSRLNLNQIYCGGNNILQILFHDDNYFIWKLLTQISRINLNHQDDYGNTILHDVCGLDESNINEFKLLLCSGKYINLNINNKYNKSLENILFENFYL